MQSFTFRHTYIASFLSNMMFSTGVAQSASMAAIDRPTLVSPQAKVCKGQQLASLWACQTLAMVTSYSPQQLAPWELGGRAMTGGGYGFDQESGLATAPLRLIHPHPWVLLAFCPVTVVWCELDCLLVLFFDLSTRSRLNHPFFHWPTQLSFTSSPWPATSGSNEEHGACSCLVPSSLGTSGR